MPSDGLSAAILDHALGAGDSSLLCRRLTERGIPYMIYTGYPKSKDAPDDLVHVSKPASHEVIVAAMEGLIERAKKTEALSNASLIGIEELTREHGIDTPGGE